MQLRSQLLRATIVVFVALAALATIGMIFEWINFSRQIEGRSWNWALVRLVVLGIANLVFTAVLAAIVALYAWARIARSLPDLKGWHIDRPASEFSASDVIDGYSLEDYQRQETRVFAELDAYIQQEWSRQSQGAFSRFRNRPDAKTNDEHDRDWNRTHVLQADDPIGGALLLHGLSDSPYSMRAIGQRLHREGYTVVWLRMPGHGTNPRALVDVAREDWTAAVQVAMHGLRRLVPDDKPLMLCGYSNGGALSVNYALESIDDPELPQVNAIVLMSPMIGINPLAKITWLYHIVSLISRSEKAKWSNIFSEIDPYKYSSWPMNANVQAWSMTKIVERKLARLQKSKQTNQLPPVLAMQSVVDSTVVVPKLITNLFDRLESKVSELFLFDVNRQDALSDLLNLSFEQSVLPKLSRTDRPFRLTVIGNATSNADQLSLRVREAGDWTERLVELSWPRGVVSLSHVAVPFPPDDPVYGDQADSDQLSLGSISMRAEPNALMIPSSLFVRCRQNPFYRLMEDHIVDWLADRRTDDQKCGPAQQQK